MFKKFLIPFALIIGLGACTAQQGLLIDAGITGAQEAKDTEARVLKVSLCATSIGAYHRILDDQERAATDILCGGDRTDAMRDLAVWPGPVPPQF